ncbi:MAG: hypothetical protein ACTSW1_00140 [Candidatus Hodarchaeales archaeon]
MDVETKVNEAKKLLKKKKWDEASRIYQDIANYMFDTKNFSDGLKYLEEAIKTQQYAKKAEKVIVLYRKIISAARKGRTKTRRELFKYSAAAIPLIEEYIKLLKENNRFVTKNGAMTLYFLGECREVVSGVPQRNQEFLKSGRLFVEVGKKLSTSNERDAEESFEKSRIIFNQINNLEETFKSYLIEAEINIQNDRIERGYILFDQARSLFKDEEHRKKIAELEKKVYSTKAIQLLQEHFNDKDKQEIINSLITKAREAYVYSLPEFSVVLFEIGKIYINNKKLEEGFKFLDEALTNSQTGPVEISEKFPIELIEYLFTLTKDIAENCIINLPKYCDFNDLSSLPFIAIIDKIYSYCRQLNKIKEIEDISIYLWEYGETLVEKRLISDEKPYLEKSMKFLVENNIHSGVLKIGEKIERKIETLAEKKNVQRIEPLKSFLIKSYTEISDYESACWLLIKTAKIYSSWNDFEKVLFELREATKYFTQMDKDVLKSFLEPISVEFKLVQNSGQEAFILEFIELLGEIYIQLGEGDMYDELYAKIALDYIEKGKFTEALEFHDKDFQYLVKQKKTNRAMIRLQNFSSMLFEKDQLDLALDLRSKEVQLLIESKASQNIILQTIKRLEEQINQILDKNVDVKLINSLFDNITKLYEYLGISEGLADAEFEYAVKLFDYNLTEDGFIYLNRACQHFIEGDLIEKVGLLLDYATKRKDDETNPKIAGRFLDFLIETLQKMNVTKEASNLMLTRAIQALSYDEEKAFTEFEKIRESFSKQGALEDEIYLYKEFGQALLLHDFIDKGLEILNLAKEKSTTQANTLSISDVFLSVADKKFESKDYDTYFVLIDHALEIYNNLEMLQEASTISLSEARKFFAIGNLAYTMIFLEKALIPLTLQYDEDLTSSAKPLLSLASEFIDTLFKEKRYDESIGFIEFQERIYRQLNQTDKIMEVERKKIDALIGRGNIDGALSVIYDIASLGIEDSKFNETLTLVQDLLPVFIKQAPSKSKHLLKLFIKLLVKINYPKKDVFVLVDSYVSLAFNSYTSDNKELFDNQIKLLFESFSELSEAEEILAYFTTRLTQEFFKQGEYSLLLNTLNTYIEYIQTLRPDMKMRIINEVSSLLENRELDINYLKMGLELISILGKSISDQYGELISGTFYKIGLKYKSDKDTYNQCMDYAFEYSEDTNNRAATLTLLYGLIEEDFKSKNYLNSLKRLDEAIDKMKEVEEPATIATRFVELIDKVCIDLAAENKKNWLDLITNKRQIIAEKFLHDKNSFTKADSHYSETIIDKMLDLTGKEKEHRKKN